MTPPVCHGDIKSVSWIFSNDVLIVTERTTHSRGMFWSPPSVGLVCATLVSRYCMEMTVFKHWRHRQALNRLFAGLVPKSSMRDYAPQPATCMPGRGSFGRFLICFYLYLRWTVTWTHMQIMTREVPRKEAKTEQAVIIDITQNPVPRLDYELHFRDFPQLWDLMMGCWNPDPLLRPPALVCKFTVSLLVRVLGILCQPVNVLTSYL